MAKNKYASAVFNSPNEKSFAAPTRITTNSATPKTTNRYAAAVFHPDTYKPAPEPVAASSPSLMAAMEANKAKAKAPVVKPETSSPSDRMHQNAVRYAVSQLNAFDPTLMSKATSGANQFDFAGTEKQMKDLKDRITVLQNDQSIEGNIDKQRELYGYRQQYSGLENAYNAAKANKWYDETGKEISDSMVGGNHNLFSNLKEVASLSDIDTAERMLMNAPGVGYVPTSVQDELNAAKAKLPAGVDADWLEYARHANERETFDKSVAEAKVFAEEHPVGASATSIPLNLMSGAGGVDVLGKKVGKLISGSDAPINFQSAAMIPSAATQEIRSTVSEDMSPTGSMLYNVGMSIADSAAIVGMSAFGIPGGTALLGSSAATSTMRAAAERGATEDQAIALGLIAGASEAFFEKYSIESLLTPNGAKGAKAFFENFFKQGVTEMTEEGATTLANTAADFLIMGDKNELAQRKQQLIANGYSEADANRIAGTEWLKNFGVDLLGGLISGGFFSTAKSATSGIYNAATKTDNRFDEMMRDLQRYNTKQPTTPTVDSVMPQVQQENKNAPVINDQSVGSIPLLLPEQSEITKQRGYPYESKNAVYRVVEIPQSKVAEIEAYIDTISSAEAKGHYKRILKKLFGGQKFTNANTVAKEIAYEIGVSSKGIGEIIARQPVNAQTLAMLEQLDEVVENAKYIASEPTSHSERRGILRTDIFETDTRIGDQPGTARMRVNVTKDGNKLYYATNKTAETKSPQPWADESRHHGVEETASATTTSIANPPGIVNGEVGDMGAKTSDFPHEVKESQSKTTPAYHEQYNIPEEGRAGNHYTAVTEAESLHNARMRLEQDYDGEVAEMKAKATWSNEEMDMGQMVLDDLRQKAEETGDWNEFREWDKVNREHKSEAGRALQALAKQNRETGAGILSNAAEALENASTGTDTDAVMQTVSEYATKFDEAVAAKNVDDLVNIIKETARTRKTGFYSGKLGNVASKPLEWALNRIASYAKSDAAAGAVAATPKAFQVGEVVIPSDRGNYGKIAKVNGDGTYDVHFVSKSGHTATKTFAADELKSPNAGSVSAADIAADPGSAFAFLKSFAAAGIENIAADKNRASVVDMAKTVRRNAMLSKFSTIMRNLVGNGVFDITDSMARDISVPFDMLLSKITGTRSVAADYSYLSKAKRKGLIDGLAMAMLETSLDVNANDQHSKYGGGSNRTFKMSGNVISKALSVWEGVMGYGLYVTDEMSKGGTSAEVQRGLNRLYEQGKIKDDSLKDGGEQEALYRTFQDDSRLSRGTAKIKEGLNEFYGAGDLIMPFAQVPANLADRAIDYSPAGLAKSAKRLTEVLIKAKKGTLTAAEQAKAIQTLGRNITGSGLIALAATMAARGIIKVVNPGGGDENKDKAAAEKALGQSGSQINLTAMLRDINGESAEWRDGDTLMSIAFLEPFNAHLTIGALLAEDMEAEDGLNFKTIIGDTFGGSLMAICDLPMFSAFGEAYNAYQYSDKERGYEKLADAGLALGANAVGSIMPNAWKGIAQGTDEYQRDLYAKDDIVGQTADQFRSVFDRDSLPIKQDVYGNDIKNPDQPLNFLNANILPGAITTYTETDLQASLNALAEETGVNSMYLSKNPPKSISVDGTNVELTDEQQRQFMTERGDLYGTASAALESDETYKDFSNEWKLKAYEFAETYATQKAKESLDAGFKPDPWVSELEGATPEEFSEALVRKVVENMAGKAGENKYSGMGNLLSDKSIDDQIALSLMSDEATGAYTAFNEVMNVPVQQFLDIYGTATAASKKKDEQYAAAMKHIQNMDVSAYDKSALEFGTYYSMMMGKDLREKYNANVKGSGVSNSDYMNTAKYYDAYKAEEHGGVDRSTAMYKYIKSLGLSGDKAKKLFLGFFAESTWEKERKR